MHIPFWIAEWHAVKISDELAVDVHMLPPRGNQGSNGADIGKRAKGGGKKGDGGGREPPVAR